MTGQVNGAPTVPPPLPSSTFSCHRLFLFTRLFPNHHFNSFFSLSLSLLFLFLFSFLFSNSFPHSYFFLSCPYSSSSSSSLPFPSLPSSKQPFSTPPFTLAFYLSFSLFCLPLTSSYSLTRSLSSSSLRSNSKQTPYFSPP